MAIRERVHGHDEITKHIEEYTKNMHQGDINSLFREIQWVLDYSGMQDAEQSKLWWAKTRSKLLAGVIGCTVIPIFAVGMMHSANYINSLGKWLFN